MDRRDCLRGLTGAVAVGTVGLAGCSRAVASVPPPDLSEADLEGWERRRDRQRTVFEEEYAGVTVEAKAHAVTYGNAALRREVRQETLGYVDRPIAVVAATRIEFAPDLDGLPGVEGAILDRTERAARDRFRSRLGDVGVGDVTRADTGILTVDSGESARLTRYRGEVPVGPFEFELTDGETVRVGGTGLAVAGDLAVWHDGDYVLVAGGAYPAENVSTAVTRRLTDAVEVSVDVDLGLEPEDLREEVRGIVTAVS